MSKKVKIEFKLSCSYFNIIKKNLELKYSLDNHESHDIDVSSIKISWYVYPVFLYKRQSFDYHPNSTIDIEIIISGEEKKYSLQYNEIMEDFKLIIKENTEHNLEMLANNLDSNVKDSMSVIHEKEITTILDYVKLLKKELNSSNIKNFFIIQGTIDLYKDERLIRTLPHYWVEFPDGEIIDDCELVYPNIGEFQLKYKPIKRMNQEDFSE